MTKPHECRLSVNVTISGSRWESGGLSIRDEVTIVVTDFKQAADILEAFHILVEKYVVKP